MNKIIEKHLIQIYLIFKKKSKNFFVSTEIYFDSKPIA